MKVNVQLVGAQPHEEAPKIALFTVDASGKPLKKVATAEKGALEIPAGLEKQVKVVAVGPDTEDLSELKPESLMQLRVADQLAAAEKNQAIQIPSQQWRIWLGITICVSGRAQKCFPIFTDLAVNKAIFLGRPPIDFPFTPCFPLCNGVVEVWEQTCCCFPILIRDVPSIIQKIKNLVVQNPILFPPPPPPGPGPDPGPIDRVAVRNVERALAEGKLNTAVVPNTDVHTDLLTLQSLTADKAAQYIQTRPSLWPIFCRCTTVKKGEAVLNPDGSFHFCFREFPFLLFNCHKSYVYKVKQFQNGQWVYVYDGVAAHQYFTADQNALLQTFRGQSCGQPPPPPGSDFLALQMVGFTPTYELNSRYGGQSGGVDLTQTGATNLLAPPADGGLVTSNGAPWAKTLSFMLSFDENLKGTGAVYYRFSVVAADNAGNPVGTPQIINNAISWNKFVVVPAPVFFEVQSESLGPNTVNTVPGLYKLPFEEPNATWWGGQYHQYVDTTLFANHDTAGNPRYMVIVELFDVNGKRIIPNAAVGKPGTVAGDIAKPFSFLRLFPGTGPGSTATVPFAALTHLFWFDNRPCYGAIEDFDMNGVASSEECQFLKGPGTSTFQVGYRAFHTVMGDGHPPSRTFMSSYSVTYVRGLNGPSGTLDSGADNNQPATMFSGANVKTPAKTFTQMLGNQTACSFAINLDIYCKHTNGFGGIAEYNVHKEAAVALEIG